MSEDNAYTGFTVSFKPGGTGYDSPMLVVRGNTEQELLGRLEAEPDEDIGTAVARYHAKLRQQFEAEVGGAVVPAGSAAQAAAPAPIWASAPAAASSGGGSTHGAFTVNGDGTYTCPHSSKPRKLWTSPKNSRVYAFCSLDRGSAGACQTATV